MPLAARITDPTMHGAPLSPGPGSLNVQTASLNAWRTLIDQHACPAVSISGPDGVGSVLMGSPTVWINNQMACRQMDIVIEVPGAAMGPADPIMMGCPTVEIGGPVAVMVTVGAMTFVSFGGLNVSGATEDVNIFLAMMAETAAATNTARLQFATVAGDTAHPITLLVGRGQNGVLVDSFGTNQVNVSDLEQVPATPPAGHPKATARDEMITHFLVERHDAAANGSNFNTAHQAGINAQNQMRTERGQPAITGQNYATDAAGNNVGRTNYADGSHQDLQLTPDNHVSGVTPP